MISVVQCLLGILVLSCITVNIGMFLLVLLAETLRRVKQPNHCLHIFYFLLTKSLHGSASTWAARSRSRHYYWTGWFGPCDTYHRTSWNTLGNFPAWYMFWGIRTSPLVRQFLNSSICYTCHLMLSHHIMSVPAYLYHQYREFGEHIQHDSTECTEWHSPPALCLASTDS